MKRIKLIFSFCVLYFSIACRSEIKNNSNYTNYNLKIIEAEKLISEEQYKSALDIYDGIINSYKFVFLRDYKIASQLALFIDKKEKALNYINLGISSGWKLTSLKEEKFFKKYLEDSQWRNIEKVYHGLHNKFLKRINSTVRIKVQKMFEKDQQIALNASLIEDDEAQEKFIIKIFPSHSEKQIKDLIKILDNYGYPGELLIGNNSWMSTIICHHNSISKEYAKTDTLYTFIKPKLHESLTMGQISPYEFALIEDWKKAMNYDMNEITDYGFINSPNQLNIHKINNHREKIGLRSVELRNSLIDIENKTGMNFYLPNWVDGKIIILKNKITNKKT